ncbi:hypothetical protein GCM10008090_10970 [Arenicella chitinivorans]|uniref:Lipoprotein n=1 Tax=Arenicella chitinivorans TaxID=1329800 RepID=A0A918RLB0_9GAMM|nr:hypothetical protein [Arenicella chitinivorans]GHA03634.1 hypothetical protein GCM10008090_10970 [Arenicella chitinivorans]
MRKPTRWYAIAICLALSACGEPIADVDLPRKYHRDGVRFSLPSNWSVTEDYSDAGFRLILVESPGDAIAKIELYLRDDEFNLQDFVQRSKESFAEQIPSGIGLEISNPLTTVSKSRQSVKLNGYQHEFDLEVLGLKVPHWQQFYEIHHAGETAYLVFQVATEDRAKAESGFDLLLDSLQFDSAVPDFAVAE